MQQLNVVTTSGTCRLSNEDGFSELIKGLAVSLHARDKGVPLCPQAPAAARAAIAFEKNARARFAVFEIPSRPVHMGDDPSRWNIIACGQRRRQPCCTVNRGCLPGGISEFADFNSDALTIA